ncbi:hypothetical protein [Phenylobacterium sp.]|jgi:hypothetical protein|uniref:hypothetical protein n=1 Tax=Phenylobacterium sp. TaxID=1871053 RepID=UPI002E32A217|nr:hypothetical protein [Phenylobacterium sp.]HEX3367575.1 hypothetical protein [Phenylobacterium sp.]
MSNPHPSAADALQLRLAALEVDLRSTVAISEALLQGLTATSPQTHHAIDTALDEALKALSREGRRNSAAVHAIVSETRSRLRAETGLQDRMAGDLERLIVGTASALPEGAVVIDGDFGRRRPRRRRGD